jgi:hypothetical protein
MKRRWKNRTTRRSRPNQPVLRYTPTAWAKLLFLRDQGDTEIGGFGMGRIPEQFARIWIHTHPGDSARPSRTDEETFARVFGRCDWAVMAILARGGATSARLRFNHGPQADVAIRTSVDYRRAFGGSDHAQWAAEYTACVRPDVAPDWLSGDVDLPGDSLFRPRRARAAGRTAGTADAPDVPPESAAGSAPTDRAGRCATSAASDSAERR